MARRRALYSRARALSLQASRILAELLESAEGERELALLEQAEREADALRLALHRAEGARR